MADREMTLGEHLGELRRVLIVSFLSIAVTSMVVYAAFREDLFSLVTSPLKDFNLPLVYLALGEAFMTQLKLSILAGFFISLPLIFWQVWSFVAPALERSERRLILVLAPMSMVLFLGGASFAYFTVFRLTIRFLVSVAGPQLSPFLSVGPYVSFLIAFLVPFGLAFEAPLVVFVLARLGMVSGQAMAKNRKFAIFAIFIMAAALTPGPDVVSQLMMAIPMLLLYEVSIWVAKLTYRRVVEAKGSPQG